MIQARNVILRLLVYILYPVIFFITGGHTKEFYQSLNKILWVKKR